jgi:hypothetical protein
MHDNEVTSMTCNIGTKEHDDKELLIVVTLRLAALGQKSTCLNP